MRYLGHSRYWWQRRGSDYREKQLRISFFRNWLPKRELQTVAKLEMRLGGTIEVLAARWCSQSEGNQGGYAPPATPSRFNKILEDDKFATDF